MLDASHPAPRAFALPDGSSPVLRGGLAPWQMKRAAAYIEVNIDSNLRVADLAGIVQLSVSHFSRAFRQSFGEPPHAYIMRQRVRLAQVIIVNSRESLARIALDCGMSDQAHFTRVFRRIVGINPSIWRRLFPPADAERWTSYPQTVRHAAQYRTRDQQSESRPSPSQPDSFAGHL